MLNNGMFVTGMGLGMVLAVLFLWTLVWKGFALWISAKENKKWWFIVMLVLNTAGILEIIYIFAFSQKGKSYIARLRNKNNNKKNEDSKCCDSNCDDSKCCEVEKKDCDCTSCEGCECECHKPVSNN